MPVSLPVVDSMISTAPSGSAMVGAETAMIARNRRLESKDLAVAYASVVSGIVAVEHVAANELFEHHGRAGDENAVAVAQGVGRAAGLKPYVLVAQNAAGQYGCRRVVGQVVIALANFERDIGFEGFRVQRNAVDRAYGDPAHADLGARLEPADVGKLGIKRVGVARYHAAIGCVQGQKYQCGNGQQKKNSGGQFNLMG